MAAHESEQGTAKQQVAELFCSKRLGDGRGVMGKYLATVNCAAAVCVKEVENLLDLCRLHSLLVSLSSWWLKLWTISNKGLVCKRASAITPHLTMPSAPSFNPIVHIVTVIFQINRSITLPHHTLSTLAGGASQVISNKSLDRWGIHCLCEAFPECSTCVRTSYGLESTP